MASDEASVLEALRHRGLRMTQQRRAIVRRVLNSTGHISPQGIVAELATDASSVDPSTVYRTLELLEELGIVAHTHLGSGAAYHLADRHDHAHLICSRCERTLAPRVEELQAASRAILDATGFEPDLTHFAISGLCDRCRRSQDTEPGSNP